jgi:pimeloyl-ACP methyl ester carboxylesterase
MRMTKPSIALGSSLFCLALSSLHAQSSVGVKLRARLDGKTTPASIDSAAATRAETLAAEDTAVRPFHVSVSEEALADLRRRIQATRWPDKETVADASQGAPLANLRELAQYWGTGYDWRRAEAKLNALPQFTTRIDGMDIYFIHVRSGVPNAMPIILTHGWPGSIFEFLKVIDPLTNPGAYGGSAQDAFDVVIPALPGYGFSGQPTTTGWNPDRIARTWALLMKRLGYRRYVAQGGDWGAPITTAMGRQAPEGLVGIHLNLAATVPSDVAAALAGGGPPPEGMSEKERATFDALSVYAKQGNSSYVSMLTARPQAIGYGMADSPVFLAAFMLVHPGFAKWKFGEDQKQSPTRDDVLDDFTLYWLTNTAAWANRLYWENMGRSITIAAAQKTTDIGVPVAITVFPDDVYRPPESWARRAYPKLVYFHQAARGGHFAAWEEPELFVSELRAAFLHMR